MRVLLDTHVAVWAVMGDERLGAEQRALIADREVDVFVSAVSLWEIAIKFALQRPGHPMPFSAGQAARLFEQVGFASLTVTARHATTVDDLPRLHGDPFDRLLVAQAIAEPLRLLTRDARLAAYGDLVTLI